MHARRRAISISWSDRNCNLMHIDALIPNHHRRTAAVVTTWDGKPAQGGGPHHRRGESRCRSRDKLLNS